jgi:hypothetical protein
LFMIDSSFSLASVALRASLVPTPATSIERGGGRFVRSRVVGDTVLGRRSRLPRSGAER